MRTPLKHEAGTESTVLGLQGKPLSEPSPLKPWSSVIWLPGMAPLVPAANCPTRSTFHGAFVASRLYSPVPSWKLERENAARNTVLSPHGVHARPRRGRKLAIPLYWLYNARLLPFCPA